MHYTYVKMPVGDLMETKILQANIDENIELCADIIKTGGLVGVPTETVYGLGANALDGDAVSKIFTTKGRQPDNPLIVHIGAPSDVEIVVRNVPEVFHKLADAFWPGPLTLIMKKSETVPDSVTAGLDTVAVRMPEHTAMLSLLEKSGTPIAAPSANLSGGPSPTKAEHVQRDLSGKIQYVLDGGNCRVGLESTVVDISRDVPQILRPGGVTAEELAGVLGTIEIYKASDDSSSEAPRSPGMKYRHYAPKAQITAVVGDPRKTAEFIHRRFEDSNNAYENKEKAKKIAALMFDDFAEKNPMVVTFGVSNDYNTLASLLFESLRQLDKLDADVIYAQVPEEKGLGFAIANRILKAATSVEYLKA